MNYCKQLYTFQFSVKKVQTNSGNDVMTYEVVGMFNPTYEVVGINR